jgi:predicted metal-binding protein
MPTRKELEQLVHDAKRLGATDAKIIGTAKIVVDERVRLKCEIPRCSNFDSHLMCPPMTLPVSEFRKIVRRYRYALIVQIEAHHDSSDKSGSGLTLELCNRLERELRSTEPEKALHRLINKLEAAAFKRGCYLALGLIGGECLLCPECVGRHSGEPCKHPFEARPSMEAMGIDVYRTCRNAGLPMALSSKQKVRWTGLVLLA